MADIFTRLERLKKERNAIILAHYYQEPQIQDIADFVGDSLELSRKAAGTDADVILFIYRDEAYDEDSPQGNKAEINIAKQRNGPIGKVNLTFSKEYTRFEDFAVDSYYDSIQ